MGWGSKVEKERRRRIMVSIYAYAYEFEDDTIVSDDRFDDISLMINPKMTTGNKRMDRFFKKEFEPCTGMWIHKHPELERIKQLYEQWFCDI